MEVWKACHMLTRRSILPFVAPMQTCSDTDAFPCLSTDACLLFRFRVSLRSYLLPDTVTRTSVPLLVAQPDGFEHHLLLLVRNSDKEREKNVDLN